MEDGSKINDVLNAIKTKFKTLLPDLPTCEVHSGRFDEEELKRVSTKAPALYIAELGIASVIPEATEQVNSKYVFAVFVITKDQGLLDKDVAARNLVETIVNVLNNQRWGLVGIGIPEKITGKNLYSSKSKNNHTMWVVSWHQEVTTGTSVFDEEGYQVPTELYISIDDENFDQILGSEDVAANKND